MKTRFHGLVLRAMLANTCLQSRRAKHLATTLAVLAFAGGCAQQRSVEPANPPPVAVRVVDSEVRPLAERARYIGAVRSRVEVKVVSQIPGTLVALAEESRGVTADEMLARISVDDARARAGRVGAEAERARTERDHLCRTANIDERLAGSGAVSRTQAETSRRACASATAALRAARAASREAEVGIDRALERAPFDGRVLQRFAEPGQNVMPGTPLLLFGGHDQEVRVPVSEHDIARGVAPGTEAIVWIGSGSLRLVIAEVAEVASSPSRSVEVRIPLPPSPQPRLANGMSARVDIILSETRDAVAVPERALRRESGGSASVFAIEGPRARKVEVVPGIRDGGWVAIAGDLRAGEPLALTNLDLLGDGTAVYPVRTAANGQVLP